MTEIEKKALALVNEVAAKRGTFWPYIDRENDSRWEALCRALERHEAYKREVSDAAEQAVAFLGPQSEKHPRGQQAISLARFIIPKPDPLVEALEEASGTNDPVEWANRFYAAIEKRGGKITWGEG